MWTEWCDTWVYENSVGAKENKYVCRVRQDEGGFVWPVEFHYQGRDKLLSSHCYEYKVT